LRSAAAHRGSEVAEGAGELAQRVTGARRKITLGFIHLVELPSRWLPSNLKATATQRVTD